MIVKFDGIDGCGKSTLVAAVAERLAEHHTVAVAGEFASPMRFTRGVRLPTPIESLRIRESVLDPEFDCDDVERQLLLHFLSRRRNRVELPYLQCHHEFVVVDRSTLSNYAYAQALSAKLGAVTDVSVIESADLIFWLDTPITVCIERLRGRSQDAVERKGHIYLKRVRDFFEAKADELPNIYRLDGRADIQRLVELAIEIIDVNTRAVGSNDI